MKNQYIAPKIGIVAFPEPLMQSGAYGSVYKNNNTDKSIYGDIPTGDNNSGHQTGWLNTKHHSIWDEDEEEEDW